MMTLLLLLLLLLQILLSSDSQSGDKKHECKQLTLMKCGKWGIASPEKVKFLSGVIEMDLTSSVIKYSGILTAGC